MIFITFFFFFTFLLNSREIVLAGYIFPRQLQSIQRKTEKESKRQRIKEKEKDRGKWKRMRKRKMW